MTNGYPVAAVIGKQSVMTAAQDTFISSTFWTERVALAAAIANIRYFEEHRVHEHLGEMGKRVQEGWGREARACGLPIHISGIYPLGHFGFECADPLACKTYFTQEMLAEGFLATTAFYASYAHTDAIVDQYIAACGRVFAQIAAVLQSGGEIAAHLQGPVCHAGFQRLN